MATVVASRFAVLSMDDDDDTSFTKKASAKKPTAVKPQNLTSVKPEGKKKKKQENSQSQNNKARNKKSNSASTSKKKKEESAEQWEEWKEKDAKLVEGTFEEDLSKAILLSKLDYERNKDLYDSIKQNEEKKSGKKNKRSQKTMSLEEFNNLGLQGKNSPSHSKTEKIKGSPEFFNEFDQDVKNEIMKEHLLDRNKVKESNSQESLTLILYKASIEKRDREIVQLKTEIERLNTQLINVKTRNTKLCQIIANGEMKDKAEVLMEVERLQTIKDELSSEVASLHIQLEQERSKVRQLTGEHKSKEKSKKHHANCSDTQKNSLK